MEFNGLGLVYAYRDVAIKSFRDWLDMESPTLLLVPSGKSVTAGLEYR